MFRADSSADDRRVIIINGHQPTPDQLDDPAAREERMRVLAAELPPKKNICDTACHYLKGLIGLCITGGAITGTDLVAGNAQGENASAYTAGACILAISACVTGFYTARHFYRGRPQAENSAARFNFDDASSVNSDSAGYQRLNL